MAIFTRYIGIDYSGAQTPTASLKGLRVYLGEGDGRTAAPQRDWQASRLGPATPESMATIRKDAFESVLAACGTPPSLFVDSDGTSQREAVRRWHLNLVLPMARLVEHELTAKFETPVELKFDSYALDMVSRACLTAPSRRWRA